MSKGMMIAGLAVYPYGFYAALATLVMLATMGVLGYQRRLPAGTVRIFGLLAIPLGIAGARVAYCAIHLSTFWETYENPWLMLNFFDGGLSMVGLLAGLMLAAYLAARLMKARFGTLLDVMCVPLGLLIAILRSAERFTELGVGKAVEEGALTSALPWLFLQTRMGVSVDYRMAVFGYEAAAGALIFIVMLVLFLMKGKRLRPGDLSLLFFSLYGATQVLLESLRDDGHMMIIFLRVSQLAAAMMPLIATGIFTHRYQRIVGKLNARVRWTWAVLALCVAGLILLEFSLDGRITVGTPSLGRDYAIMSALCAVLFAMPCSFYITLNKRLYREEYIAVHVPRP